MSSLSTENLTLSVTDRVLVNKLTLQFNSGECWAVIGPNGSGKTTLLHALAGLRRAEKGCVSLNGDELKKHAARDRAKKIGVLLQEENSAFHGTVTEYVELGLFSQGTWLSGLSSADLQAHAAMKRMDIGCLANRPWSTLSGGERQRTRLAQLLAQAPDIFLLDEPLLHLDLRHQLAVLECFQALARFQRKTVVMVLHDALWASQFCDHTLMLYDDGICRFGPVASLINKDNLARLYGCSMDRFDFHLPA